MLQKIKICIYFADIYMMTYGMNKFMSHDEANNMDMIQLNRYGQIKYAGRSK